MERPGDGSAPAILSSGVAVHVGLAEFLDVGFGLGLAVVPRPDEAPEIPLEPTADLKLRLASPHGAAPGASVRLDWAGPQFGPGAEPGAAIGAVLLVGWEGEGWATWFNLGSGLGLPPAKLAKVERPTITVAAGASFRGDIAPRVGLVAEAFVDAAPELGEGAALVLVGVDVALSDLVTGSVGVGPVVDFTGAVGGQLTLGVTIAPPAPG